MPACRLPVHLPLCLCLCGFALGCVTEQTKKDGSFVTGGPGQYGQPAPGTPAATSATKTKNSNTNHSPSPKLQLALAQFQEQRGFTVEARKSYEQVLAADAKSTEAIIGLARLDQVAGRSADAEAGFQRAIQMDPHSGYALDALGQFYAEQKRWNEALQLLQRAQAAAPTDKTIRFHHAITLARAGQIDRAVPLLMEAVGPAAAHYNIGLILHERGDLAGSGEQFETAIIENPRLEQAQYWLNQVRREQEQVQPASASDPNRGTSSSGRIASAPRSPASRTSEAGAMSGGVNAGFPVEPVNGAIGQTAQNDDSSRLPAGHSAAPGDFGPPSQMTAPVSPLARSGGTLPDAGPGPAEQWNNQR
jgi:Flp pilus assembly protein TadD